MREKEEALSRRGIRRVASIEDIVPAGHRLTADRRKHLGSGLAARFTVPPPVFSPVKGSGKGPAYSPVSRDRAAVLGEDRSCPRRRRLEGARARRLDEEPRPYREPRTDVGSLVTRPHSLEKYSPWYPQGMKPLGCRQVRPYIRPTCYPAVSGGESVIRLILGKLLLVNLSQVQVVKWTNTPLIP